MGCRVIVKLIISFSVICFSVFEFMYCFNFKRCFAHTHSLFCAFAFVFILLALGPKLSSFVSTVQYEVRHRAGKSTAGHHLWEVTHSILLLYWLQSTKTLPTGLCFTGLVPVWCTQWEIMTITSWFCIINTTGNIHFQH